MPAASSATATVSSATSTTVLAAARRKREGMTIYNASTAILYVLLGEDGDSSTYTVPLAANSYYEVPFGYTGVVSGAWASVNGSARVTEVFG
jgi:hypothetical protein